jgi:hypothetical protein
MGADVAGLSGHPAEACNVVLAQGAVTPAMATKAIVAKAALKPIAGRSVLVMAMSPFAAGSGQMPGWR